LALLSLALLARNPDDKIGEAKATFSDAVLGNRPVTP